VENKDFIILNPLPNILRVIRSRNIGSSCSTGGTQDMYPEFWSESLNRRSNHVVDQSKQRMIILKWILEKYDGNMWTRFIQLWNGTSSRLL